MPHPSQASLDTLFARATRVRVLQCGAADGIPLGGPVLVDASGEDVARIREHLRIVEGGQGFHCMCLGDLAIELLAGDSPYREERLTTLGFHHASSLRHPSWSSDAMLVDGPALVRWLATQGATGPLRAYAQDLERARLADRARREWLQAAPPCFRDLSPDDPVAMLPNADDPALDASEARLRATYANAADATHALLSWFGSGAGPWSGYPAYEGLAENLLHRLGLDVAREVALSHASAPAVMRGAARLFSSWNLVAHRKSAVGDVPVSLWDALRPFVRSMGIADNTARFEHAVAIAAEVRRLRARGAPKGAGKGLTTAAVSRNGALAGLLSDGRTLFSGEANDIVAFAGLEGRPIFRGTDPYFEMAGPVSDMIMVAHINGGTVGKVLTEGSDLVVMVRDQPRPLNVVVFPGTVAWLNAAQVPDPVRGAPYVVQQTSVMLLEAPAPRVVRAASTAFSLAIDDERLYWCETAASWEIWCFAYRRDDPPRRLAVMGERPSMPSWFPKLRVNAKHVVWADPDARAIVAIPKRPGVEEARPFVLTKTQHSPAHLVVDDHDAFVLSGHPEKRAWHVEHARVDGPASKSSVVGSYERQLWDRPGMVIDGRGLFFTTNDRVLALPRA